MAFEFYTARDLTPVLLREITDFLDSQDTSHLFQFPQWSISGTRFALLREGGGVRWFGSFGMHSPLGNSFPWMRAHIANRGPVCDEGKLWYAAIADFAEEMRRENIAYLDVAPDWVQTANDDVENAFRDARWKRLGEGRTSLRLDLTRHEDVIFAGFRKNSRYEIRRAERLGVSVAPASCNADMEAFLALHARLADRKNFRADSPVHLRGAIQWFIDENSRGALLLARSENVIYGGAVVGRSGRRCWYLWGAADKHEHFNVGHILQWKALLWAKSHGCTEYDFGGYTPGATSGPAWFKAGFGAAVVHFVPPHRKVIRRARYRLFKLAFQMRDLSQTSLGKKKWSSKESTPVPLEK